MKLGGVSVSRETIEDLKSYEAMLKKWTKGINLIAPSTIEQIWQRHIIDSAQIYALRPQEPKKWVDLGSGGGLPGLVVSIIAKHEMPSLQTTLIESDQRKAIFLQSVIRDIGLNGRVIPKRIDMAEPQDADIVSARALTSISNILPYLRRHLAPDGIALLHKGKAYRSELADAADHWAFTLEEHPSLTDPDARLLCINNISPIG